MPPARSLDALVVELDQLCAPRTVHVQVVPSTKVPALSVGSQSQPISAHVIKGRIEQFGKMLLM